MRLIDRRDGAAGEEARDGSRGGGGELIEALMANVTDSIDDPPLDVYVGMRPPASATLYDDDCGATTSTTTNGSRSATAVEFVIHMQLPPTFPLSSERCRMLTPILHPLVAPLWDGESGVVRPDGGRMARPSVTTPPRRIRTAFLFEFREALVDPVACAARVISSRPSDANATVRRWAANVNGEMEAKARLMAIESRRIRWKPELHGVCPRAFRAEVRTLLLVIQRIGGDSKRHSQQLDENECEEGVHLPREIVWLIIDALLQRHLSCGSLLFS
jgi:hypothetical protein